MKFFFFFYLTNYYSAQSKILSTQHGLDIDQILSNMSENLYDELIDRIDEIKSNYHAINNAQVTLVHDDYLSQKDHSANTLVISEEQIKT